MLLRERMPPEHNFIYKYAGPNTEILKESKTMFNMYSLNRTESITSLYYALKMGRIRCFDWSLAEPFLMECMNLVRTPNETAQGTSTFLYRKHGSKADDILHAMNFAYVTARVFAMENIVEDHSLLMRMKQAMMTGRVHSTGSHWGQAEAMSLPYR